MPDPDQAWLDEHLGAWVRHLLQSEPEVATAYNAVFRGDPVGAQWLTAAAGTTATETVPAVAEPAPAVAPTEAPDREQETGDVAPVPVAVLDDAIVAQLPEFAAIDPAERQKIIKRVFEDAVH